MLAKYPQVARFRDRINRRLWHFVLDNLARCPVAVEFQVGQQFVEFRFIEPGREREFLVILHQPGNLRREDVVIPRRKLGGAVVGDCVGRGLAAFEIRFDGRDRFPTEAASSFKRPVASPHNPGGIDDDRLLLAEATQTSDHRFDIAVAVRPCVGRVVAEVGDCVFDDPQPPSPF